MKKENKVNRGILTKVLFEQENVIAPSQTDPVKPYKNISLDQNVDKYLVAYEKQSIPTGKDYEIPGSTPPITPEEIAQQGEVSTALNQTTKTRMQGESFNKRKQGGLLSSVLFEADEEPIATDDAGGDAGVDMGGLDSGGGDTEGDSSVASNGGTAPVIDTPKINLNNFAMGIARLVNNYESLLDPKGTIINRAIEYIRVNYDEPTAKEFKDVLEQAYDIRAVEPERDQSDAPFAAGALVGDNGGGGAAG